MPTALAEGIVLDSINFNDYDRIVTVFTKELGKLSLLARGVNKPASKNKYSLNTLNNSRFEFFKSSSITSLSKLKTGILIKNFNNIAAEYWTYEYASAVNYLLLFGLELRCVKPQLYQNLLLMLDNFNQGVEILKNFVYFLFYGLPSFGGPRARDGCSRCGQRKVTYALYHLYDLQFVCGECQFESERMQNKEWLNFIHFLSCNCFEVALKFPINQQYVIILGKILLTYYRETLGLGGLALQLINQKPIFSTITNDLINFLLQY